jgi:CBS-domain-containing membrane protein
MSATATDTDIERQGQRRGGLRGELLLAIPPTVVVLLAVLLLETLRHERILFASLAASAFLIYRDPAHPMNGVRVMVMAHSVAVIIGVACGALLGPGYDAAALAMVVTFLVLIVFHIVHPPAVSTALGFAFFARPFEAVGLFVVALGMIAVLIVLQRTALWMLRRRQAPTLSAEDADS